MLFFTQSFLVLLAKGTNCSRNSAIVLRKQLSVASESCAQAYLLTAAAHNGGPRSRLPTHGEFAFIRRSYLGLLRRSGTSERHTTFEDGGASDFSLTAARESGKGAKKFTEALLRQPNQSSIVHSPTASWVKGSRRPCPNLCCNLESHLASTLNAPAHPQTGDIFSCQIWHQELMYVMIYGEPIVLVSASSPHARAVRAQNSCFLETMNDSTQLAGSVFFGGRAGTCQYSRGAL